jgi:hypothetical protein
MSDELDELRREVAAVHGLPPAAASFIAGQTLEELEASAAKLAELIGAAGARPEQERAEPLADVFGNTARRKQEQQRALVEALHGRPQQPRDERGRFASSGFDGGARESVPHRRPPEREHDELIVSLSRLRRAYGVDV